jgi:uncharacterized membrane protein YkvA (DUF1232 family)
MKSFFVAVAAVLSALYLLNPTAGFLELIPDNIPFVGNLDEATAMAVLVACLRFFGYDITRFFGKKNQMDKSRTAKVVDID